MVITFANQKGGVGKSTLAMLFANWLTERNESVVIIDLDRQSTIHHQRERDKSMFSEQSYGYDVLQYDIDTPVKDITSMLLQLKKDNEQAYIIIDAPGNLSENGLVPFLALAEVIICPFQYERKALDSTGTFIVVLQRLLEQYGTKPKQVYLPNRVRINVGNKEERELYEQIQEVFKNYGLVSPYIKDLQCLARVNSFGLTKEQDSAVSECFNWLKEEICKNSI